MRDNRANGMIPKVEGRAFVTRLQSGKPADRSIQLACTSLTHTHPIC